MFCNVVLDQLVKLLEAMPIGLANRLTAPVSGISTDTRSLSRGQVFLALRGENFDGHEFVETALEQGAIAVIVDTAWSPTPWNQSSETERPLLQVKNTLTAYQALAHWWRQQFSIPVIAVTGSVGKTTTKELIAAVLTTQGQVLKTQANDNNEIGVPKTLLGLEPTHQYAVIEMGMRGRGEIELLTQIARPDIAVITNVGTAHIGRLGSEQAIAEAKCELLAELAADGIAVLNHDNARLIATAATVWTGKTLTYGLEGGDLHGHLLNPQTLILEKLTFPLPLPGRHNALNYLAALAIAKLLQIDWLPLTQGLTIKLPPGRSRRETLPNDIVILDETYNAGLESMLASLHLLAETPGNRHIAILGTMKELGERSPEFHQQVGMAVRRLNLDHLLVLADPQESEAMAAGAFPLSTEQFATHAEVVTRLLELVQPGDRLLFKASRAVGLDRVVKQFQAALQKG